MTTVAERIVARLVEAGVTALFGMPGGGSNLDLVEAAGRAKLPFILSHTETAGALMASAQAELTGRPGACLATLGPGVASLVNGAAHAFLDRVPLVLLTAVYLPQDEKQYFISYIRAVSDLKQNLTNDIVKDLQMIAALQDEYKDFLFPSILFGFPCGHKTPV